MHSHALTLRTLRTDFHHVLISVPTMLALALHGVYATLGIVLLGTYAANACKLAYSAGA